MLDLVHNGIYLFLQNYLFYFSIPPHPFIEKLLYQKFYGRHHAGHAMLSRRSSGSKVITV